MNRDREFCSNTLYWSMLSLCGISYQDFPYRMDLFSDQFLPQKDLPAWKQYLKMKENKTK